MSKRIGLVVFNAIFMIILAGCVSTMREPSQSDIQTWDFGSEPIDYKRIILAHPALVSNDVDKPHIEFQGAPRKTWVPVPGLIGYKYGWGGFIKRFGGKTGSMTFRYIIRNNDVILFEESNDNRTLKF